MTPSVLLATSAAALQPCEGPGPSSLPTLAFLLPDAPPPSAAATAEPPAPCPPGRWLPQPLTSPALAGLLLVAPASPAPEAPQAVALRADGQLLRVQLRGELHQGAARRLLAELPLNDAPPPEAPPAEVIALLPRVPLATVDQPLPVVAPGGVVRRVVGRKSAVARGRFLPGAPLWAAAFKVSGDSLQLAIFSDNGQLRLHRALRWRERPLRARPMTLLAVPDLGGPGRDGLLVRAQAAEGPVWLLVEFGEGTELIVHRP